MLDMFSNYQNLTDSYIPNNLYKNNTKPCSYTKLNPIDASKPFELYDSKGLLEGYYWNYGDSVVLDFDITGEIILDDGTPSGSYVDAAEYLKEALVIIKLYNFRLEEIHKVVLKGSSSCALTIDSEFSKKLLRGIYYCSLEVEGKELHETLFSAVDCKLLVK